MTLAYWYPHVTYAMVGAMPWNRLEARFMLDRQWHCLLGEMERTKRPVLVALAQVLAEEQVPYAIIGSVALQVHQTESHTTLDVDVAVTAYDQLPCAQLAAADFTWTGQSNHAES